MSKIWFISDTHFGHANILTFKGLDGKLIRPNFADVHHMNEVIINNWNALVDPLDKVYHLGDVSFSKNVIEEILPRLNGRKRLILGNHDTQDVRLYRKHFQKVLSWRDFHCTKTDVRFVATHAPLHPSSFDYRAGGKVKSNVHGHLHEKIIWNGSVPDTRFINVCVEHTDYKPVSFDDIVRRIQHNGKTSGRNKIEASTLP